MYKIELILPSGEKNVFEDETLDCYSLVRSLEKCVIKSFKVSLK